MKIAVIGAGAMGSIYGGRLSQKHDVYLVDTNQDLISRIAEHGLKITEQDEEHLYYPHAAVNSDSIGSADLIILFVKALFSENALNNCRSAIGANTYIMTLQNGSGHEDIISKFVPREHIMIGTTEDNGTVLAPGHVRRGGTGRTNIGMLEEDKDGMLSTVKDAFDSCGFQCLLHDNIEQLIWDKLFINVSLSAVTGILQVPMGFIADNEYAWKLTSSLVREAAAVAHALNLSALESDILDKVRLTSQNNPLGLTSIYADLKNGRKTEADSISGYIVRSAKKCGIPVPTHETVLNMIHAMEGR